MHIRNDVVVSKNKRSKAKPWTVRWWGKYDIEIEKQPRYSKSFPTKKMAQRYAKQIRNPEERTYLANSKLSLEQLCEKYMTAYKPSLKYASYIAYKNTIERLKSHFSPYCNINSIREEDAFRFINNTTLIKLKGTASDSTKSRHLRLSPLFGQSSLDLRWRISPRVTISWLWVREPGGRPRPEPNRRQTACHLV